MPKSVQDAPSRTRTKLLKRLTGLFVDLGIWTVGIILVFEEWGWDRLAAALAWLGRRPGLRWIEGRIRALPPYGALAAFAVPILSLLPVKLFALYCLARGHAVMGIGIIVGAKLLGTAIAARLFMLTRPTLMQLPWFERWLGRWLRFKDAVLAALKSSAAWQRWMRFKAKVKRAVKRLLRAG